MASCHTNDQTESGVRSWWQEHDWASDFSCWKADLQLPNGKKAKQAKCIAVIVIAYFINTKSDCCLWTSISCPSIATSTWRATRRRKRYFLEVCSLFLLEPMSFYYWGGGVYDLKCSLPQWGDQDLLAPLFTNLLHTFCDLTSLRFPSKCTFPLFYRSKDRVLGSAFLLTHPLRYVS